MPKIRNARNVINIWPLCGHVLSGTQRHERNLDHGQFRKLCNKTDSRTKETYQSLEFSLTLLTFCEIPPKGEDTGNWVIFCKDHCSHVPLAINTYKVKIPISQDNINPIYGSLREIHKYFKTSLLIIIYQKISIFGNITLWNTKKREIGARWRKRQKWKKYDKGETMPISFALYGDDSAMISMPATFRFISHWYVCIKATNSKV